MLRKQLGVVLDHVARLRQLGGAELPDPVHVAAVAETAGADMIVVHMREDRAGIQARDVRLLRQTVRSSLVLRFAPTQEMIKIAYDIKPDHVTLVPELREEGVAEPTVDLANVREHQRKALQSLRDADTDVSVLIDPTVEQVKAAHRLDLKTILLDTHKLAHAKVDTAQELQRFLDAARTASKLGMHVVAGGGLDYRNVPMLAGSNDLHTLQIGHSIAARAMLTGFDQAVRDMIALLKP